ncbi:MAG: hypothetical protein MJ247_07385 [Alphaproteobacteria bacterium]|nr:hypothetical protein [Alphaproteobacteria bacterium]
MEENKLTTKQETEDTEIVELKDEDLKNVSAGSSEVKLRGSCIGNGDENLELCLEENPLLLK